MCREMPCQPRLKKHIQIDMSYGNTFGTSNRFSLFILMNDFVKKKKKQRSLLFMASCIGLKFYNEQSNKIFSTKNKLIVE